MLLPFQELSYRTGATFKWIDLTEDGRVRTDNLDEVITERTKVVAVTHVGNATGAITNIAPIIKRAHEVGSIFILDACQSVPHLQGRVSTRLMWLRRLERAQDVRSYRRRFPVR